MENANLPTGNAHEPTEEAKQIEPRAKSFPIEKFNKNNITFAENIIQTTSQKGSSYKEVLSQPAPGLSHRQKLLWLQKRRSLGVWAQCDECDRWRYLPNVLDSSELTQKWYCRMNTDKSLADCSAPETPIHIREEEDLIHSLYSAGSVVWARLYGWPWWPAMVDDCPDVEQFYWLDGFSDIPTHYNVVFFDAHDVTRAWITPEQMKPYNPNGSISKNLQMTSKYRHRLDVAMSQADDAVKLPLFDRLEKYSFIARYKGNIGTPKRVNQKDLLRYQKVLKRKFYVEFPIESSSDSENEELVVSKKKVTNASTEKNNEKRGKNAKNNVNVGTKTSSIQQNKGKQKLANSERSNNEPDSVAVLVGSDRDANTSLVTTSNSNDVANKVVETEPLIQLLQNHSDRNSSAASDDFDFL